MEDPWAGAELWPRCPHIDPLPVSGPSLFCLVPRGPRAGPQPGLARCSIKDSSRPVLTSPSRLAPGPATDVVLGSVIAKPYPEGRDAFPAHPCSGECTWGVQLRAPTVCPAGYTQHASGVAAGVHVLR